MPVLEKYQRALFILTGIVILLGILALGSLFLRGKEKGGPEYSEIFKSPEEIAAEREKEHAILKELSATSEERAVVNRAEELRVLESLRAK